MPTSASKRNHGAIASTTSTSPPRLPRNTRRKLTPDAEGSSNSSPLSSSSVVSSSASSHGDSSRSQSPSNLPKAPQASLHSRLRSFLPQLAAANASLSEAGTEASKFELEAVAVEKVTDGVEGDDASNTRKRNHVREVKDVSDMSQEDESTSEEGEQEEAPYIEMVGRILLLLPGFLGANPIRTWI